MEVEILVQSNVTAESKETIRRFLEENDIELSDRQIEMLTPALVAIAQKYPLPEDRLLALVLTAGAVLAKKPPGEELITIAAFQGIWEKEYRSLSDRH